MRPAARFEPRDDIEEEKKACKATGEGGRESRAANGIDWKDDAPAWWLAGRRERRRRLVGRSGGPHGFRRRTEATGGKRRERGEGEGANQVLISRCGNFGGNWSTRLRSIPQPPNMRVRRKVAYSSFH